MSDPARSDLSPSRPAQIGRLAPARVMLVDDSIVARAILERIIASEPDFEIVAAVPTASDALGVLAQARPHIIVLDLEMPGMNGLAALPLLIAGAPNARVIILSANCEADGPAAMEALALGAADTLLKPGKGSFAGAFGHTLVARLRALRDATEPVTTERPVRPQVKLLPKPTPTSKIAAIGIGASTGGITAIHAFLHALPPQLRQPIFITQHLPAMFVPFFAAQLRRVTNRSVVVGQNGLQVEENHVYLAPGDGHLQLARAGKRVCLAIGNAPAKSGAMPSVDPMMVSMSEIYGAAACGVMLSGMGRDGVEGARAIRSGGGLILAQNAESSVVWGMPGAVAREGIAAHVLAPEDLAPTLAIISGQAANHV